VAQLFSLGRIARHARFYHNLAGVDSFHLFICSRGNSGGGVCDFSRETECRSCHFGPMAALGASDCRDSGSLFSGLSDVYLRLSLSCRGDSCGFGSSGLGFLHIFLLPDERRALGRLGWRSAFSFLVVFHMGFKHKFCVHEMMPSSRRSQCLMALAVGVPNAAMIWMPKMNRSLREL